MAVLGQKLRAGAGFHTSADEPVGSGRRNGRCGAGWLPVGIQCCFGEKVRAANALTPTCREVLLVLTLVFLLPLLLFAVSGGTQGRKSWCFQANKRTVDSISELPGPAHRTG